MILRIILVLIIASIAPEANSFVQDRDTWLFSLETHSYDVHSYDKYTTHHVFEGMNLTGKTDFFYVSIRNDSELLDLELEYYKGDKKKSVKISKSTITSTVSSGSFFSGNITYLVPIDPNVKFSIHYSVKEKHSIFISTIRKKGYYKSSKVKYEISLKDNMQATLSNGQIKKGNLIVDSSDFAENEDLLYVLIHPENSNKEHYFSDWFETKISKLNSLEENSIPDHLTKLKSSGTKRDLAEACFKYIQNEIRYLDIENGINAIIPRPCKFVLTNKYGDCKDMANALVALLNYFDIEAYNCLSQTNSETEVFNFPTLGQVNHMIVGLKLENEWIFLDPTESNCLFGDPSIQIFGTNAFAIGNTDQYFLEVPDTPASKTEMNINYQLDLEKKKVKVTIDVYGKMNTFLDNKKNDGELMEYISNRLFSYYLPLIEEDISNEKSKLIFEGDIPETFVSELSTRILLHTDFMADMRTLFLISSYRTYPVYPLKITSKVYLANLTCDQFKAKGSIWRTDCTENYVELTSHWKAFSTEDKFEESSEWTNYTIDFNKPIFITP